MRYIGNKTKLLPQIANFLRERGVRGGSFLDLFSGTVSVARHFRALGFQVASNDLMRYSFVFGKAYLTNDGVPQFRRLPFDRSRIRQGVLWARAGDARESRYQEVCRALTSERLGEAGIVTRQFSPEGPSRRGFFTPRNARRIDAILARIERWRGDGLIDEGEFYLLLATLIDAADRVANSSGVYGAYLKGWQRNALRPIELRPLELPDGPIGRVFQEEARELVRRLPFDLIYLDPPYNHRQYPANYHLPEVLAEYPDLPAAERSRYEESLRGKVGLLPYRAKRSALCSARDCAAAFSGILQGARGARFLVSYSEEGIMDREAIARALEAATGRPFNAAAGFREISYRRYRSDADRKPLPTGSRRSYKVLAGKPRDVVSEWLFYAARSSRSVRSA